MNPLILDQTPEYRERLATTAMALEVLDPHKRMGSRLFAAFNRMGNTSSVIFPLFRDHQETGNKQVLLQLRPAGEVRPHCWGLPASGMNADEDEDEVIARMVNALGCKVKVAVKLYGAVWYMSATQNPFPDKNMLDVLFDPFGYFCYNK